MDTQVPVVGRAIKTEVYAEGDGRPGRVFRATVEAYLRGQLPRKRFLRGWAHTLFAGFVLSFSKIFWDCALVALMANAL